MIYMYFTHKYQADTDRSVSCQHSNSVFLHEHRRNCQKYPAIEKPGRYRYETKSSGHTGESSYSTSNAPLRSNFRTATKQLTMIMDSSTEEVCLKNASVLRPQSRQTATWTWYNRSCFTERGESGNEELVNGPKCRDTYFDRSRPKHYPQQARPSDSGIRHYEKSGIKLTPPSRLKYTNV